MAPSDIEDLPHVITDARTIHIPKGSQQDLSIVIHSYLLQYFIRF